jgi:hypothetical protein
MKIALLNPWTEAAENQGVQKQQKIKVWQR